MKYGGLLAVVAVVAVAVSASESIPRSVRSALRNASTRQAEEALQYISKDRKVAREVRRALRPKKDAFGVENRVNPGAGSRSERTNLGEEGYIPGRTQLSRMYAREPGYMPTPNQPEGAWDPFAVTGRSTYGNIPGQGWGYISNQMRAKHQLNNAWFMPNSVPFSECDPAIHQHCSTAGGPSAWNVHQQNSFLAQRMGLAGQFSSPTGWWTFHPAMSMAGTPDPIPNKVPKPVHPWSHYWSLLHPAGVGPNSAGSVNPNQAYIGGFGGLQNPNDVHRWVGPAAVGGNPYQRDEVNQYPQGELTAAPLSADAGAYGPYAFAPPHILGSSFMPPHVPSGPSDPTGTNGFAPESPFAQAPVFEVLRAAHGGMMPVPLSSVSLTAPWLNPSGYSARSADPGRAGAAAVGNYPVYDRVNKEKFTQSQLQEPARLDKMEPGPEFAAQVPAPDGPYGTNHNVNPVVPAPGTEHAFNNNIQNRVSGDPHDNVTQDVNHRDADAAHQPAAAAPAEAPAPPAPNAAAAEPAAHAAPAAAPKAAHH